MNIDRKLNILMRRRLPVGMRRIGDLFFLSFSTCSLLGLGGDQRLVCRCGQSLGLGFDPCLRPICQFVDGVVANACTLGMGHRDLPNGAAEPDFV